MASYSVGSHEQKANTFLLNISASNINDWVSQNIPAYSTISAVTLTFTTKKSYTLQKGDIEIKVGGVVAYDEAKQVESDTWNDESYNLLNYVQTSGANAGKISGDVQIFIDGPWSKCTWYVNNIAINYSFTPPVYYTATFKNWDGTILKTEDVRSGLTPTAPSNPTRPKDLQYTYSFSGWSPSVGAITGNTTYTAQFTATLREYTVYVNCLESESGEKCTVSGAGTYKYGDAVTITVNYIPPYHSNLHWRFYHDYNAVIYSNPLVFTIDDNIASKYDSNSIIDIYCCITHTGFLVKAYVSPDNAGTIERGRLLAYENDDIYSPEGLIPAEGYTVSYELRDVASLKAIPNEGYKFVRWSDGNTAELRRLYLTGDATYTAYFELDKINNTLIDSAKPKKILIDVQEVKAILVDTTKVYG